MSIFTESGSILLIEDDIDDAFLIKKALNCQSGSHFVHTTTIQGTLAQSGDFKPSIILLDLNLSDSRGSDTINTIKRSFSNIPIIVLTGSDDEETSMTALEHGASDFLSKGEINKNNLKRMIVYTLERAKLVQELKDREEKLNELYGELEIKNKQLLELSIKDPLTGLFNRRYIDETLKREIANIHRNEINLFFIIFDIDKFKLINDIKGHDAGDAILVQLSNVLEKSCRNSDVCGRYGGDEFIAFGTYEKDTDFLLLAKRLQLAVRDTTFSYKEDVINVSISIGVSTMDLNCRTPEQLFLDADNALYQAKENGRDQTVGYNKPDFVYE